MLPLMSQMNKINARALQIMKSVCTLLTVCYMHIFSRNLILSVAIIRGSNNIFSATQYSVHQSVKFVFIYPCLSGHTQS